MKMKEFQNELLAKAKEEGFLESEVFIQESKSMKIKVFKEKVDSFENSAELGISFRGIYNQKMGYAYSEKIDEETISYLIQEAKENALVSESEDLEIIFEGEENYPELKRPFESNASVDQKIEKTISMEKIAKSVHPKISALNYCLFSENTVRTHIKNSKGLDISNTKPVYAAYASCIAKDDQDIKTGYDYFIGMNFHEFLPFKIANNAANHALEMLHAKPVSSGLYDVIINNEQMAELLECYAPLFFADEVQKGFSLFKDKQGKFVGSTAIHLKDYALSPDLVGSTSFDDEGTKGQNTDIIKNGVLQTFLYNCKSAAKDKRKSTGNGFKASFKSPIRTSCTNFFFEKGDKSFDELLKTMKNGIFINRLDGLHTVNPVIGDFSLSAMGFKIKNGSFEHPVEQITIAGNFYELLYKIVSFADDLRFSLSGSYGSPSVYINKLDISG